MANYEFLVRQARTAIKTEPADLVIVMENGDRHRGKITNLDDVSFTLEGADGFSKIIIHLKEVASISFSMHPMPYGCNVPFPPTNRS